MKRADLHMQSIIKAIIFLLVLVILLKIFVLPGGLLNRAGDNVIGTSTQTHINEQRGQLPGGTDETADEIINKFAQVYRNPKNRPCLARFSPPIGEKEIYFQTMQGNDGSLTLRLGRTDNKNKNVIMGSKKIPGPMHLCSLYGNNGPQGFIEKHLEGKKDVLGFVQYHQQLDFSASRLNALLKNFDRPPITRVRTGAGEFEWWSAGNFMYVFYPEASDHLATATAEQKANTVCILPYGYVPDPFFGSAPNVCRTYENAISSKCVSQMETFLKNHECQFDTEAKS